MRPKGCRRRCAGSCLARNETGRTSYGWPTSSSAQRTRVSRARPTPPSGDRSHTVTVIVIARSSSFTPASDATMSRMPFVPDDFQRPLSLAADGFLLEPLGPEHNEDDYDAWSSSIEHIRATPGYPDGRWPRPMTLDENRADLERHARDFTARSGFTYTVLDPSDRSVIGCVYIYPDTKGDDDAIVLSWVRATHAVRDAALRELVSRWLAEAWPFERISYPGPG